MSTTLATTNVWTLELIRRRLGEGNVLREEAAAKCPIKGRERQIERKDDKKGKLNVVCPFITFG